jgi:hypothetical protein
MRRMMVMKKKILVLMLVGMLALAFSVGTAMAAGWYVCTISEAGTSPDLGYSWVTLTDTANPPAFTGFVFTMPITANGLLAAGLTAVANSSNVRAYLLDVTMGAPCTGLCVVK